MVIFPPGLVRVPVLITVPPNSVRLLPDVKVKLPSLTIAPGCTPAKLNALGVPTNML